MFIFYVNTVSFHIICTFTYKGGLPREINIHNSTITYSFHEFAIYPHPFSSFSGGNYRDHSRSGWPGVSLNPGIWDLDALKNIYNENGVVKIFDENSNVIIIIVLYTIAINMIFLFYFYL